MQASVCRVRLLGRERDGCPGLSYLQRLDGLLLSDLRTPGELARGGRTVQRPLQLRDCPTQPELELLQTARQPHRACRVPQVAPDLAQDCRRRKGCEGDAAVRLEAVDGFYETDRAHLDEILQRFPAMRVAPSERGHEWQVLLDYALAGVEIASLVVIPE